MAKDDEAAATAKQARLTKLIALGRELHEKLGAVLEEADEMNAGGYGMAAQLKAFQKEFDRLWGTRYAAGEAGRYVWRFAADVPNQKRLIKTLGLQELITRAVRYINTEEPFLVKNRHPFGLFASGINSYAAQAGAPADFALERPASEDCRREGKHVPPCGSDQEHTRRKMADMKA